MSNRLVNSTSPYLQQHADNPVHWWEWGEAAFEEARRRDVPILLSVGYAACHWCHVMAHESFEDDATADVMNEGFVNVKVDREERPDVDAVYMQATQALTGHGGWPMTVFLDHERRAFYAGTYFPPQPRHGMPSFLQILDTVSRAWHEQRENLERAASRIAEQAHRDLVVSLREQGAGATPITADVLDAAAATLWSTFDGARGGFGGAPKFPPSTALEFLLRHHARTGDARSLQMVERTCDAMARGGMYDQIGGGFARYAVDADWVVPHFEKMLYDNALLLRVYLHWWRQTHSPVALRVVRETAAFLLHELRTAEGGFASALDADSLPESGGTPEEGAFYVWTPEQLTTALGDDLGARAARWFSVTESGTFEHGTSTLQRLTEPGDDERDEFESVRETLREVRDQRPRPARDDKVVAAWNGLAMAALAEAGALLDVPEWTLAARTCAELLERVHLDERGRLLRVSRDGLANPDAPGVLEDHANVADGLLTLFQCTGEVRWLHTAERILGAIMRDFTDAEGGFFDTAHDVPRVTSETRPRDPGDGPTPSGWSAAAQALLTHAALTGDDTHRAQADHALALIVALGPRQPRWMASGLCAAEALIAGPTQVAIVGPPGDLATWLLHRTALGATRAGTVIALGPPDSTDHPASLLHHRGLIEGQPAAYVCHGFTCDLPVTAPADLAARLTSRVGGGLG